MNAALTARLSSLAVTTPPCHRYRYDADYVDSALYSTAVAQIATVVERAVSVLDDTANAIEASEDRNAAYEAQAMR